jgi:hypothetical protein
VALTQAVHVIWGGMFSSAIGAAGEVSDPGPSRIFSVGDSTKTSEVAAAAEADSVRSDDATTPRVPLGLCLGSCSMNTKGLYIQASTPSSLLT